MPPKAKITKEMIIEAGFEIVRESGAESISARSVSERLGCSTQPVMYHFGRIDDLKQEVYRKADEYHTAYIMNFFSDEPLLDIGVLFVRFAYEEKRLYKFLFQSDEFKGTTLTELLYSPELDPIMDMVSRCAETDTDSARDIFRLLFLAVQGYAAMLANNSIEYDEQAVRNDLELVFEGAVTAVKSKKHQ